MKGTEGGRESIPCEGFEDAKEDVRPQGEDSWRHFCRQDRTVSIGGGDDVESSRLIGWDWTQLDWIVYYRWIF